MITKKMFLVVLTIFLASCVNNKKEIQYIPEDAENVIEETNTAAIETEMIVDIEIDTIDDTHVSYRHFLYLENAEAETKDKVKAISIGSRVPGMQPFDYTRLWEFKNLEGLRIYYRSDEIVDLGIFSKFKKLKYLHLNSFASRYVINDLGELTELESLSFLSSDSEIDFYGIQNFKKLNRLNVYASCKMINLDYLSELESLEYVDLTLDVFDNESFNFLGNITGLKSLTLYNSNPPNYYDRTDKNMYFTINMNILSGLKNLKDIRLTRFIIDNIEALNTLDELTEVFLIECYSNHDNEYDVISDKIDVYIYKEEGTKG